MTTIISGTSGLTFPDNSTQAVGFYGFKNRIINGAMMIDQRNAGASVTITTDGQYTLDRWRFSVSQFSKFTAQQSSTVPTGFKNSIAITVASAVSSGAADYFGMLQPIEGYNVADFGFGTASASTITISFWARSSLTGTFSGMLYNNAANRTYCFTYTINSANTYEYKTITVAGDTTGTWTTDNTTGLAVYWDLGSGSNAAGTANTWSSSIVRRTSGTVQLVATAGATLYITGVQLEKGSTATSFDYRPYGTELQLCQRYYQGINSATNFSVMGVSSGSNIYTVFLIVPLRASPSFSGNINIQQYYFNSAGGAQLNQAVAYASLSFGGGVNQFRMVTPGAGASGLATWFDVNSGSLQISAEL